MKKTTLLIVLSLLTLLMIAGSVAANPQIFGTHMQAASGVDSEGQGEAKLRLDGNNLKFVMHVKNLSGETLAAHIHFSGEPGGNGPPVISLCGSFGPPPIPAASCGGTGDPVRSSTMLTDEQVNDLIEAIASNRAYVNVHTTAVPSGEIRGQLTEFSMSN